MIHIVCSTDKKYIMPTGVMIESVSYNNIAEKICFHIIVDEGVSEKQKEQLKSVISTRNYHEISFHTVSSDFFLDLPNLNNGVKSYITAATYYRLLIADIMPQGISKIIYLDGDIIVRRSLKELWMTDITGKAIAAVADECENSQDYKRLGYSAKNGYFNAGVLLINIDYWKKENIKKYDYPQLGD